MIDHTKILGLIPARGGSKGVPRKNIRVLGRKPLIAWTIEAAMQSQLLDRIILSSEDEEIIEVARSCGCEVPFVRPAELAADNSTALATALHALQSLAEEYEYLVLLQPTSPLRTAEDIDGCIRMCHSRNAPSCTAVCQPRQSPYWMFSRNQEGYLVPLLRDAENISRRQDLPPAYVVNGAVYVAKTSWLRKTMSFVTEETLAYEMPEERSIDIDTELDFKLAEIIVGFGREA